MELEPHLIAKLKDSTLDPTQRVVEAIMRVGPRNAALISRLTGVPTETVRYKIKRQLKEMGFRIHANIYYEKLGLTRHLGIIDFMPEYAELAVQILKGLHEVGYLVYYAKIIPHGYYAILLALPEGSAQGYDGFLRHLVDLRIIQRYSLEEVAWSRHLSMNPKYFDFDSGDWEFDWTKIETEKVSLEPALEPHDKAVVDKADLLLIKELQKDALQSIIDVARKVKIHPKTLRYHYHVHVESRGLIPRYLVRWMRDIESTKAHSIIFARIRFSTLTDVELIRARTAILKVPMSWSEYLLKETKSYLAEVVIPVEQYGDAFSYLSKQVTGFGQKMAVDVIDPFTASSFTIPYTMFDEAVGWTFDPADLKVRFSNLANTLR